MSTRTATDVEAVIIALPDDDAVSVAEARRAVAHAVLTGRSTVIVDLHGHPTMSSTTVALLISSHRMCRSRGGTVVLRGLSVQAERVVTNARLDRLLRVERHA